MNLSTNVKSNVIVFYDKSLLQINQEQADYLFKLSTTGVKGLKLNNQYYTFNSISKILSLEEYYKQYPNKRPTTYKDFPELPKSETWSESKQKEKQAKRLEQMIIGITKYVNENTFNLTAKKLKEKMEHRLELVKKGIKIKTNDQITRFAKL